MAAAQPLRIDGKTLYVKNLEKVFYPKTGFTKGEVLEYYIGVAPHLLPHLANRPLTLKRYPDGVEGEFFYQKESPSHRPEWIKTARVPVKERTIEYTLVNDLASLVWVVNLADLEIHPLLAKAADVTRPTHLAFDLDPGAPADVRDCARVALRLRDLFRSWDMEAYPKTSGSKGFQVYVPLNTPVTYDDTKPFARRVAGILEAETPKLVTSNMSKTVRPGKVFVDWSQNDEHKTTVAPYSLRARERPTVSTPLSWDEVEAGVASWDVDDFVFEASDVLERAQKPDPFKPVLTEKQRLPDPNKFGAKRADPSSSRPEHEEKTQKARNSQKSG